MDRFKFRQPIYDLKGDFERFHYWGRNVEDGVIFSTPENNNGFKVYKDDEQCTGLKDKNGSLYYFNDIGEFDNGDRFIIKSEDYIYPYVDFIGDHECEDQARDFYRISNAKIIGNIHTGKQLLEG